MIIHSKKLKLSIILNVKDYVYKIRHRLYKWLDDKFKNFKKFLTKESIKELLRDKLRKFFEEKDFILSSPKDKNIILLVLFLCLGLLYKLTYQIAENLRLGFFNFLNELKIIEIAFEFIKHSRKLILLLLISLGSFIFIDVFCKSFYPNINVELIKNLLTAYVGGITAILGIIFALYSVGFQITTAIYSSKVAEYVNQERVGRFFFQILVFTGVSTLVLLIFQNTTDIPLIFSFLCATFLTIFSLLGILIYRDDYITKLRSKSIFQLIYNQNYNDFELINKYNSPEVASFRLIQHPKVKSFRINFPIHKSWSVLSTLQKNIQSRIKVHKILFKDLIKNNSYEDASFGITTLGYTLIKYIEIKPYIDKDLAWWFPRYEEIVKSEDFSMFPIKANYEAQGIGMLHTTKVNYDWLEDEIIDELERIQNNDKLITHPEIISSLIFCYEIILPGKYEKTLLGYEKKIKGIFELQNYVLFERVLNLYFQLGSKIKDDTLKPNYINTLGQIKTVIADGFSIRHFPGKLKDWKVGFEANIKRLFKTKSENEIIPWKQPQYFHSIFIEYWNEIQVEKIVEGKYITTQDWLVLEVLEAAKIKEKEIVDKYTNTLLNHIVSLTSIGDKYYSNNLSLLILHLFNQLISQNQWAKLSTIISKYNVELFKSFITIERESFLNLELRDPIDFGLFASMVNRRKAEFKFYLTLFFLTQIHMSVNIDKSNISKVVNLARRPLIVGSLAYLISELDSDFYFVNEVVKHLEGLYVGNLPDIMFQTKDILKGMETISLSQIIYDEANRYRTYYRRIINSIIDLPPKYETHGSGLYGFTSTQTVEHPSVFIRQLASFRLADMDECYEGFIEWLEKREEIKKVILIIKNKKT